MEAELDVETECKNCNHSISLHTHRCSKLYHEFTGERVCGCERPQYYGAIISDTKISWTEFHCNECGSLIGFLNSLNKNIYEILENKLLLCVNCIQIRRWQMPTKLTTTINKIQTVPNQTNSAIIHEFYQYMNNTDSSVHHKNNNLKVVIAFANFLGSNVTFQV